MADIVKTVGYFAHWKVNNDCFVNNNGIHSSESFKIAMWRWKLIVSRSDGATKIQLYPQWYRYKVGEDGLNLPIASFQIRILDFVGKQSHILAQSEQVRDLQFRLDNPFDWRCDIKLPLEYWIEVEFSRLQSSNTTVNGDSFYFNGYKRHKLSSHGPLVQQDKIIRIYIGVSNETIPAHQFVLCSRSNIFKEMFKDPIDSLTISDMTTKTCKIFIDYFYGIVFDEDLLNYTQELLEAAKKYDVIGLTKVIEKRLIRDITTQNVVERLTLAYHYQLEMLKVQCIRLLVEFGKLHQIKNDVYNHDFDNFLRCIDKDLLWKIFCDFIP